MDDHAEKPPHGSKRCPRALSWAFTVQALALLVLVFGDFGFDRPGRFGLDFGHLVLFVAPIWCLAALAGLLIALGVGWRWFFLQWGMLLLPLPASVLADLVSAFVYPAALGG